MYAHHAAKMENQAKFNELEKLCVEHGWRFVFVPTKYVRNWPTASTRPYQLKTPAGGHLGSYGDLGSAEKAIRNRAAKAV